MKNIYVFLLVIVGVFSLDDQTYIRGFANQIGLAEDQITDNINCFSNAATKIEDFKTAVTTSGASISDTEILNWMQQVKLVLMEDCSVFESDVKEYFSQNSLAPVFQEALCNNIVTYNTAIKQKLVTWASSLNLNQEQEAGKKHAFIYQILFGVVNPTSDPIASFTFTSSGMVATVNGADSSDPDGIIAKYKWNFGEQGSSTNTISSSSSSTASHTYTKSGTYIVSLTVTDNSGRTGTTTSSVRINAVPTVSFTYSNTGTTVTFNAEKSSDPDGTISNYAWTFGDSGSPSNTASGATSSTTHTYPAVGTYSVSLTLTDNDGATSSQTQIIRVNAAPIASFTKTISGRTVAFTSTSTDSDGGIVNYEWNFGESGSSSNIASGSSTASHTYSTVGGSFTVSLKVTDTDGAIDTITQSFTILPNSAPTADFTPTLSVSSKTITFNAGASVDLDGTIKNYKWNFGEPSSSSNTLSTPSSTATHTFALTGTYTVTLIVTDNEGATATATKSVKVNAVPAVIFTTTVSKRVATFNAGTITDSDGTITNYSWNFGDSSSGSNTASGPSTSTATHTYPLSGGTYLVTLVVTDSDGATPSLSQPVTILPGYAPTASFTHSISGNTISFNAGASTDSDGTIVNYAWNFGEPSSGSNTVSGATSTLSHTYSSPGTYTVSLTVTDDEGTTTTFSKSIKINVVPTASFTQVISGKTMTFNAGASTDSDGTIVNYAWNFGESGSSSNTASSTSPSASHTYASYGTYTVSLVVTDSDGATATQTKSLKANAQPTASFTSSISGRTVTFNGAASSDFEGPIANYAWNFGEPSSGSNTVSSASSTATHTYSTNGGTFVVTLIVTDSDGATSSLVQSITIQPGSAPTVSYTYSMSGNTLTVNSVASDSDGTIATLAWNFGEPSSSSNTASIASTSHTYSTSGTYTVTFTATDDEGASTTVSKSIKINAVPTASYTYSISDKTLTFNAGASTDADGTIDNYAWDFGESGSSSNTASGSSSSASHTYASYGTFTVVLTITDNDGGTSTKTQNIKVSAAPVASFSVTSVIARTLIFDASASTDTDGTIASYRWTFGSGSPVTTSSATQSYTYSSVGTYTVTLTVTDNDGITASTSKSVEVPSACNGLLHFIASWDKQGDYDLMVGLPNGGVVGYYGKGPDSNTQYSELIVESGSMSTPEEVCWRGINNIPATGTYHLCLNPYSTSGGLPSTGSITVIKGGSSQTYTKSLTSQVNGQNCNPSWGSYITSISYP